MARWNVWPAVRPTTAAVFAVAGVIVFFGVAHEVTSGATQGMDTAAMRYFAAHRTPALRTLMQGISLVGSGWALSGFALLSVAALRSNLRPDALRLLVGIGGGELLVNGLKWLYHRPRPAPIYAHLGYSFPSGHSFFAVTLYGLIASQAARKNRTRHRWIWTIAALLMLGIGFSRVCVGVHYPTDVVAGLALGVPWLYICLALPLGIPPVMENTV